MGIGVGVGIVLIIGGLTLGIGGWAGLRLPTWF